jgi:hypothetical protein
MSKPLTYENSKEHIWKIQKLLTPELHSEINSNQTEENPSVLTVIKVSI